MVAHVITLTGTCSVFAVVICTASVAAFSVSGVSLKVVFLPGDGTVYTRDFYSEGSRWC